VRGAQPSLSPSSIFKRGGEGGKKKAEEMVRTNPLPYAHKGEGRKRIYVERERSAPVFSEKRRGGEKKKKKGQQRERKR